MRHHHHHHHRARRIARHLAATAACLVLAPALSVRAADAPAPAARPPIEAFFNPTDLSGVVLSPSGKSFAMLARSAGGRRRLIVGDTAAPQQLKVVGGFNDADIVHVDWVNDDRLVFRTRREDESAFHQLGAGLFAVDKDGANARTLVSATWETSETGTNIKSRVLPPNHYLDTVLRDGTSDVVIERVIQKRTGSYAGYWMTEEAGLVPLRLDTRNGTTHEIVPKELVEHARDWLIDDQGRARLGVQEDGLSRTLVAPPAEGSGGTAWRTISQAKRYENAQGDFYPRAVGPDGTIYVNAAFGDTSTLNVLGPDAKPVNPGIVDIKGFDFSGDLVFDRAKRRLLGVHYRADAPGSAWFDPAMTALQARLEAKLPGLAVVLEPAECGCSAQYVVEAASDRQPAVYFLYDAAADKLVRIGAARPAIDARRMADTDFYRFKARDGMEIPAYVTHPAGKGPWPTVVLVHGGPWLRGAGWTWEAERQFLSSRGYLVVEPEFRGSEGYGARLYRAGFKQWGGRMQDDVADATRWAAAQGWSDPARVCLMGGSYGGYATLMGLVKDGPLYRCGVAIAAPTNLIAQYDYWWSDFSTDWRGAGLPELMGDKVKDAELLKAASPALHADRIDRPVMLVHGGGDNRVPIDHATAMRDALTKNGKDLTWVVYGDEAHGIFKPENRVDLYRRIEAFLDKHIGAGAAAAAK